ncbi:MAG: Rrf2 family transcriptional regulator [Halorubrum sp.]
MSMLQLSASQERILTSLVNLADDEESVISGREIADSVDRNPGTVRNRMQSLRALDLVEGVAGPEGGYKPTERAYEVLGLERLRDPERVPVERGGTPVEGVTVREIDLSSVNNPELCRAEVVLHGSVRPFEGGDRITVGPTPTAGLQLSGVVDAADIEGNSLMIRVDSMETATGVTPSPSASD